MTTPGSQDRWTFCGLGHVHWGAHGGAGLLLRYVPRGGEPVYLLTERSRWVDEGGTCTHRLTGSRFPAIVTIATVRIAERF